MEIKAPIKGSGKSLQGRTRWILTVIGIISLGIYAVPQNARAGSILETVGISILAGTVLGASTLPFYQEPGSHLINVAVGAGAGAVVGLGIWVYGLVKGSPEEEKGYSPMRTQSQFQKKNEFASQQDRLVSLEIHRKRNFPLTQISFLSRHQQLMPVVSLVWLL